MHIYIYIIFYNILFYSIVLYYIILYYILLIYIYILCMYTFLNIQLPFYPAPGFSACFLSGGLIPASGDAEAKDREQKVGKRSQREVFGQ